MAAATEYYVDPSIAGDSGTGTIGDPYGDLQYALNTVTRNSTDGDRFNIKAGTDEILAAALTLATYGVPAEASPLIFQGYTTAAADGGIGGIDGNATYAIIAAASTDAVIFIDLHLHNCGAATWIVQLRLNCKIINCEIDGCSGGGVTFSSNGQATNCHFHNIGAIGFVCSDAGLAFGNFFENGANSFTIAMQCVNLPGAACFNIFSLSGTSDAIDFQYTFAPCTHNSIFTSGTGVAIRADYSHASRAALIANNLIEGWTTGLLVAASPANTTLMVANNSFYDNGTDWDFQDQVTPFGNESLGTTPFAKSDANTYALRATYFAPVDTGSVLTPLGGMATARGAIQVANVGNSGNQKSVYRKAFVQISTTLGSDATQDIWSLMAPAASKIVLHGWELTSTAVAASIIDINLHFISAVGSGGTAATVAYNPTDSTANAVGVLRTGDTTPGTPSGALMSYQWEQLGPVGHTFTPEMRPVIDVSTGIALTCNTAATPTLSGWICWEEI